MVGQVLKKRFRRKRPGFMLLELIIVIAIIGILAAVAVPNFLGMTDEAKIARIKADLSTIGTAAEMYNIKKGSYPTSISDLVSTGSGNEGYLRSVPEPPDSSVTYQLSSKGEATATFKGVTYSSFGTQSNSST